MCPWLRNWNFPSRLRDSQYSNSPGWGVLGSRWPSSHLDQAGTICGAPPQQGERSLPHGSGALRRLGAPRETFIFPELYHFFHNTTLPSRWKVPAGRLRILSMCFCSPPCPSVGSRLLGKDTSLFIPVCSRLALLTDSAMEMSLTPWG